MRQYTHLSQAQRSQSYVLLKTGYPLTEIARVLGAINPPSVEKYGQIKN